MGIKDEGIGAMFKGLAPTCCAPSAARLCSLAMMRSSVSWAKHSRQNGLQGLRRGGEHAGMACEGKLLIARACPRPASRLKLGYDYRHSRRLDSQRPVTSVTAPLTFAMFVAEKSLGC